MSQPTNDPGRNLDHLVDSLEAISADIVKIKGMSGLLKNSTGKVSAAQAEEIFRTSNELRKNAVNLMRDTIVLGVSGKGQEEAAKKNIDGYSASLDADPSVENMINILWKMHSEALYKTRKFNATENQQFVQVNKYLHEIKPLLVSDKKQNVDYLNKQQYPIARKMQMGAGLMLASMFSVAMTVSLVRPALKVIYMMAEDHEAIKSLNNVVSGTYSNLKALGANPAVQMARVVDTIDPLQDSVQRLLVDARKAQNAQVKREAAVHERSVREERGLSMHGAQDGSEPTPPKPPPAPSDAHRLKT